MLTEREATKEAARRQRDETIEQMLMHGEKYRTIVARLGVSTYTISVVARKMREAPI